ncbi:MAG: SDR family oxidoreductase [Gammaproteobacteria bacterium]|nr:SDR family oxidoreductase [Gammaproteobacteria bacterium]
MESRLYGKKALVTAAGQGIGRATAVAFAKAGAEVIATDINEHLLASLQEEIQCQVEVLNVLDARAIQQCADQYSEVNVLFNAAGFVHSGNILVCTDPEWDLAFNLNVRSQFWTIRAFLPGMLARSMGSIINVSSVAGSIKGVANRFVYGTTKAAVIGLTKAIAADYVNTGVRCNAICPGTVDSPSLRDRMRSQAELNAQTPEEVEKIFVARQPMGRLGTTQEIASLAVYLASDESSFTTGVAHIIDGGWSL